MRRFPLAAILIVLPCVMAQDAIAPAHKIQLFDGKSLDGWYTWLRDSHYEDPKGVFSLVNGQLRISGEEWGGIATKGSYRNYHLVVEWRWGTKAWGERATKARDSGILIHGVGKDGAASGVWLESYESQIIEGGTGDIILVAGANKPSLTATVRHDGKELYWDKGGEPSVRDSGRIDWYGRSPSWKDELGFRGENDVEVPAGQWNRQEVIADGKKITYILNGRVVNEADDLSQTAGKIQIQSEGAEIYIRKVEVGPAGQQ
jgi:hypothetical protein